ncbi:MAG: response regulator [Magnetococcus sp. DMHC-6]
MEIPDHILVVDDDPEICQLVGNYLEKNNFRVSIARNGREFSGFLEKEHVDLIILDLMLPGEDGLTLCRNLRSRSNIPVIILSAKGEEMERIIGLEMGADDYLSKPFHPRELLARVKSVLRRARSLPNDLIHEKTESTVFRFSGWSLDTLSRQLFTSKGESIPLSGSEFNLLSIFLTQPNRVLSRDLLLELSQGREFDTFDRSIDMQVSRLRRRLRDDPKNPQIIKTVRSSGYVFCSRVEKTS